MKRKHLVIVTALLISAIAATAYAAMPRPHTFDPPTAAELGLDSTHTTRWTRLREETIALKASARAEVRSRLEQADKLLASDSADLNAFSSDIDHEIDAYLAQSRDLRDRKLALYQSLSPSEQASTRAVMRERIERAKRLRSAFVTLLQDAY
jgi:hypothetical protein